LMLPAAGNRPAATGSLNNRGYSGHYWTTRVRDATYAYYLSLTSAAIDDSHYANRGIGYSVRCIAQ